MNTDWDVVIVGGGTAGLFAGIASGRLGARTLLIERSGFLGGNIGTGMSFCGMFDGNYREVVRGIPGELVRRVTRAGGGRGHVFLHDQDRWISSVASLDPEVFKHIAFEMLTEASCSLWLYTTFVGAAAVDREVTAVEVSTKVGIVKLTAKVFIDASGDADLAAAVGVPFERGGSTHRQGVTCMIRVGNVDLAAVERFMEQRVNTDHKTPWTFQNGPLRASQRYWTPWKLFPDLDKHFAHVFGVCYHGGPGDVFINCTHTTLDSLDPDDITAATIRLRKQAMDFIEFFKAHVWGFEKAYLTHVYDLGIRESRRMIGEYVLTMEDVKTERHFDDVVAMGAYPPDLHDADSGDNTVSGKGWSSTEADAGANALPYNPSYEIPYRCLLPLSHDNLLVAGRCISATFEAQSGTRGMAPCAAMGQAVGTAAALACHRSVGPKQLEIDELQRVLLANDVCLSRKQGS